uniref:Muscle M-line assembly protein unc-89 n=1 Tax=Gongylonema pulchrum TaxID=637853 RepID=A0A183CWJ3_9BILA
LAGTAESEAKFAVECATEMPKFLEGLQELSVQEAETAQLSVTVVGKPEPEVAWFKDGVPVNIDNEHVLSRKDEKGHYTLILKDAGFEDIGTYSCKASNQFGTAETQAKFAVLSELVPPSFTEKIGELEVPEHEKAELSCIVVGKPEPQVKWMKDGVEVHIDNTQIFQKSDETGRQTLIINEVNKTDFGTYTCVATNQAGTAETVGQLNFPKYSSEKVPEEVTKPFFIEPLETHSVQEGETVVLECRVNEESKPEIQWYLDDKPIQPSEHLLVEKLESGTLKLTIQNASKEDVGTYRCEAINMSGKAATAAKLNFATGAEEVVEDESALLGFIEPLTDVAAQEGTTAELLCAISTARGDIQIHWYKDGAELLPQQAIMERLEDGTIKLKIDKVTAEDVGTYRCSASIGDAFAWTEGKLTVSGKAKEIIEGEGPPEFIELLKSCTVTETAEAVLRCKLEQTDRMKMEFCDDGTIVLTVKDARKEDSGEYRCDASNDHGAAWTTAPLKVATEEELPAGGEAPDFTEPVRPVTVTVGETAVLEGKVVGEPKPEIRWYCGENMVKENARITMESLPDGTQKLIFKNATIEDTDEYRCVASNEFGDVWSDATLKVQVPVTVEEEGAIELAAPTFLKTLQDTSVNESEQVVLECKIVGEPMPEVKWFKDKQEIKADDAHFKKETLPDGIARLTIDSATKADAGEFRCEAQNSSGTARAEAQLNVLYAFEAPVESEISPEFVQELQPVQATEGQQIAFECSDLLILIFLIFRVAGVPVPKVKWFRDGEEVVPSEHVRVESFPDGTNRLTVDSVSVEDQGNYRCEATNNAGSMSSKAPLTVNALEVLKLKKGLEDKTVQVGTKLSLYVEVEGQPKVVKWFRGKDEIKSNRRIKIEQVAQEYSLEVEKAEKSDEGPYRVVLSTETETVESSCTVTVTEGQVTPTFKKGLQDQSVPKGS